MQATKILMDEHRLIERVLAALQLASERVSEGEEMRPAFFINAALFIKNYADGCHHHKEEGLLFAAMNKSGNASAGGPIGVMLAEHEQGRELTRAMLEAARNWERGNMDARAYAAHNALGYVALLRQHIQKEDNVLFPLADYAVPAEQREKLDADFEQARQAEESTGVHEKYQALAEVLEKESGKRIS
jgi:hemerythrin-like domain-containing protein